MNKDVSNQGQKDVQHYLLANVSENEHLCVAFREQILSMLGNQLEFACCGAKRMLEEAREAENMTLTIYSRQKLLVRPPTEL